MPNWIMAELPWRDIVLAEISHIVSLLRRYPKWGDILNKSSVDDASVPVMGDFGKRLGLRVSIKEDDAASIKSFEKGHKRGNSSIARAAPVVRKEKTGQDATSSEDWLKQFDILRERIVRAEEIPATDLLTPFLEIIRSGETDGQLTVAALTSVEQFLRFKLFDYGTPGFADAVRDIARAATRCRFLSTASGMPLSSAAHMGDEAVLLRILLLAEAVTTDPLSSRLIDDASVCEVMETALSMCCQARLGEVLRRSAERAVQSMIRTVFSRVADIEEEDGPANNPKSTTGTPAASEMGAHPPPRAPSAADIHMHVSSDPIGVTEGHVEMDEATQTHADDVGEEESMADTSRLDTAIADVPSKHEESESLLGHGYRSSHESAVFVNREDASMIAKPTPVESTNVNMMSDPGAKRRMSMHRRRPSTAVVTGEDIPAAPFGLPAIRELTRVLVALVDPRDRQYNDAVRLVALNTLRAALEVSGVSMERFVSLRKLIAEDLCRHLFQTLNTENVVLLQATLRATELVLSTMPTRTRFQRELFVQTLMRRLTLNNGSEDGTSTPTQPANAVMLRPEAREMLVECLVRVVVDESIASEIWVNYDCEVGADDIFERSVRLLCQYVTAEAVRKAPGASRKALDGLMRLLTRLAERAGVDPDVARKWRPPRRMHDSTLESPDVYIEKKLHKRLLQEGASRFNQNPKEGIAFIQERGIIPREDASDEKTFNKALAVFLKTTPSLNKRLLGEYLSKKVNLELLRVYVELFDFREKRIDEALRLLLEGFRLPGEAQQIERIMEVFSTSYFATKPAEIATQDATFVLCYSIIMLNTDLHNPQVKRRMTMEDYMKNLRSVNDGKNFAPEYLVAIYEAIRDSEIIMPEERDGTQEGFDFLWREMSKKARLYGRGRVCDSVLFDRDIFEAISKPIADTFLNMYEMAQDDMALETAHNALISCAALAAKHEIHPVIDGLVRTMAQMTGLVGHGTAVREHRIVELPTGEKVSVSRLAVRFGQNYKGQLAAVMLFTVVKENATYLQHGWESVWSVLKALFCNALIPDSLTMAWDPVKDTNVSLPLRIQLPQPETSGRDSWFSYLMPSYSETVWEPTEGELEYSRRTCRCVMACDLANIFVDHGLERHFDSLNSLLEVIMEPGDREELDQPARRSGKDEHIPYDALDVFSIEMALRVVLLNSVHADAIWTGFSEFLLTYIVRCKEYHSYVVKRAVAAFIRLALSLSTATAAKSQSIASLITVQGMPPTMLKEVAEEIGAGVMHIVMQDPEYAFSAPHGESLMGLITAFVNHPEAAPHCFETAKFIGKTCDGSDESFLRAVRLFQTIASSAEFIPLARQTKEKPASVVRGIEAVEALYQLRECISTLVARTNKTAVSAWSAYWFPILSAYIKLCSHPVREIRIASLGALQRLLILPDVSDPHLGHAQPFDRILFPLMEELLRPEVRAADPAGVDDMRVRVASLLCSYTLQQLPHLLEWDGLVLLWSRILEVLGSYVRSGHQLLVEAVTESMKNVILVMSSSGAFPDVQDLSSNAASAVGTQRGALWEATWKQVDSFLPGLKQELFPPPPTPTKKSGTERNEVTSSPPLPVAEDAEEAKVLTPPKSKDGSKQD